jgi:hypothetical protein
MELTQPEEVNVYELDNLANIADKQTITFYKKNIDGTEIDGTTLEEMLRVSITRLKDLNNRFGCRENSIAITKLEEALMWLNKRTQDRIERGVEGKHVA